MADSALGSALAIPKSALDAIKMADERIQSIQNHSQQMGQAVNNAFTSMTADAKIFSKSLEDIIIRLDAINSESKKMSGSFSNLGAESAAKQINKMGGAIIQAAQNIDRLINSQMSVNSMEQLAAKYAEIYAEKRKQAEEKVQQAKLKTQEEITKTAIAEEKAAATIVASESQKQKIQQQASRYQQEKARAQAESAKAEQEEIKAKTAGINKSAEETRATIAETKATKEKIKALTEEVKVQTETAKKQTAQARLSVEEARTKKAEAQAHLSNAQAVAKEARAKELIAKAQQSANNANNRTTNFSDFKGVINQYANASSLREHAQAVKDLKQARLSLITTDNNYKQNLASVNDAIKHHSNVLKEAGVNARALTEQTSYMAGYMSRWAQRMAFAFSVGSIKNFVEQIASVRGQFELSERSLEAILQNKPKADEIFNKTVELAVKSPFRIKDLVDYTRQLSAYRIESDKLYDTTKRLADVSAGLGVDMGRLILAYGQVKAAAYLRGSEVRQFTEAGINMYGELQQYFKEVKGEAYTTAQIVDMISKRMVKFEDVEAVFQRMTDQGGLFYNMQEQQADTLAGKISNLKDAFDVMLNDIGKRWDGFLKGSVSLATSMLNYWNLIGDAIGSAVVAFITYKALSLSSGNAIKTMMGNWKALRAIIASTEGVVNKVKAATTLLSGTVRVMKSLLTGIAVMALYDLSLKVYESFANYDKAIEESNENTAKLRGNVNSLSLAYDKLKSSSQKANKEQNKADNSIVTKKRAELQALVDEANKNGYIINIDVKTVEASKLDKIFDTLKAKYQNFITYIQLTNEKFAKDEQWDWLPGQNSLKDVVDKYNEAATNVMSHTNKIDNAINVVKENYDEATVSTKKWFDAIMQGRRQGESDLSYYSRMTDAINHINLSMQNPSWLKTAKDGISSIIQSFAKMMEAEKDAKFYFKEVFGDAEEFKNKYGNDPQIIKYAIDKTAADKGWGDFVKEMLYKTANTIFHVKIKEDKASIEETATTIHDQLQRELDKRKVNIKVESLYNSPLHNYVEDAEKLNKSLQDYQDDLKYMAQHPKKYYLASELMAQGMDLSGLKTTKGKTVTGNDYVAPKYVKEYILKQMAELRANGAHSKQDDKDAKNNAKEQRDILSERISLLKEMNKQYEQLDKYMDDDSAAQSVMKHYAANLKYVGMPNKVVKDFVPDKQGLIQALKQIEPTIKDFKKRAQLKNDIVELQIQLDTEFFQQQLNDVKNEISKSFDQLNLYKKLQGEGLSDGLIKSMFGDLTSSFADVRKGIEDQFTAKFGNNTKWSSYIWKQYQEQMDKLDKEVYQDQVNQAQELIKAYKQQLTDQLQLDRWYINERYKLQNNAIIAKNPELQKQLQENLTAQYKKKTGENTWKNFQGSDMYVKTFENLDHTSTKVLDYMIQRLQSLREEMKNLDPTQVKAITEQISKLQETRNSRNPFKAFTSGLKELVKYTKEYKKLGGDNALISTSDKYDKEEKNIENQGKIIANLDAEYNKSMLLNGLDDEKTKTLKTNLDLSKNQLDNMKKQHSVTKDTLDTLNNVQGETDNAKNKFSKSVTDITSIVSSMATAFNGLFDALGGSDEQLENTLSVVDNIGQAIGSYYSGNYAGVVSGAMGALTGVAKLFSNEGKIDKEIARQERAINSLQHAYEMLKKSMDDAFDTQKLYEYNQKSVDALKKQQKAYQAMINAERGRKKPDEGKIQEWEQQIDDLNTTIQELGESMTEALGGFGSQSNYKSAAEAFSKAWVDAFNEGSDALEALNNKFDEYFNTMLTKQLMNRATSKYIQPILEAFDKAVSEGSEGGNNGLDITKKELEGIKELKDKNLALFNEYAKNLMDVLNVKPTGSSNISALQQGIQSVTESTAQALESILNSCRWYIAQQQQDVRAIRTLLEERLGNVVSQAISGGSSNQMITLMEQQSGYLRQICDNWASVMKTGHSQGGRGLKVFMN